MPNWCSNTLTVIGDEAEIARFQQMVTKVDGEHESFAILESLLPCPQELRDTVVGWSADPEEQEEYVRKQNENRLKYGYGDWYDWCCANWGTKWSDSETDLMMDEPTTLMFSFDTAWSPPNSAFVQIAKKFSSLTFIMEYDEEGMFFAGASIFKGSHHVINDLEPKLPQGLEDLDIDEYLDKTSDIMNEAKAQALQLCLDEFEQDLGISLKM